MKRFIGGFLAGAMLFGSIGAFAVQYAANPVDFKVLVNGEEFTSDPPALEVNGRTYLPLRAIGDALGVPVTWNEELRQAEVGNSAPVAKENEYSRTNPAPLNTVQTYSNTSWYDDDDNYDVSIRVLEIQRGKDAYDALSKTKAGIYPEPEEGYEYMNVKIAFSVLRTETDAAVSISTYDFDTYTSKNVLCPVNYWASIEPQLNGNLYEGGDTEGWVTVQVRKDDDKPKLAYGLDYDGKGGVWFKLYE